MFGRRDLLRSFLALPLAGRTIFSQQPAGLPFLQNVTSTEATLLWPPGENASAEIEWVAGDAPWIRCSTALRELAPQDEPDWAVPPQSSSQLSSLPPGSVITYQSKGEPGSRRSFRTPSASPTPFSFLAFGDSGAGTDEQFALAGHMEAESADFSLHTGDVVYPLPTPEGIRERYLDCYRNLMASGPLHVCLGNHDYAAAKGVPFLRVHSFPSAAGAPAADAGRYYSFFWNSAQFIALDSNSLTSCPHMLRWLDAELERPAFWRVIFFHHPPYTLGTHSGDPICRQVVELLAPRLEKAGVHLVLNGHDHNYQRFQPTDRTVWCVTGGGGGGLYPVTHHPRHAAAASVYHYVRVDVGGWQLRLRAIGLDGQAFDETVLAPPPMLSPGEPVNLADYSPALAPDGLAALFGSQLALAPGGEPPQVTVAGQPARVLFAAPGQINILLPSVPPGRAEVVVRTPNGVVRSSLALLEAAPAIFRNEAGSALTDRPPRPGSELALYVTGLGRGMVEVECSGRLVPATGVSDTPDPGVQSVVFRLPADLSGAIPVRLRAGSAWSKPASLRVD